jgi:hypothetical protein
VDRRSVSSGAGLYKIRKCGELGLGLCGSDVLAAIAHAASERLYRDEMPYNDPHTALAIGHAHAQATP